MTSLTNDEFESVKRRLNAAIHEIVFACHHAEEDNLEDAANCLMTAQGVLEEVAREIVDTELTDPKGSVERWVKP